MQGITLEDLDKIQNEISEVDGTISADEWHAHIKEYEAWVDKSEDWYVEKQWLDFKATFH